MNSALKTGSLSQPDFLPLTKADMNRLGWAELDVLLISGDAYIDHPAFGPALLGRWLVDQGFKTGIIAQPDWRDASVLTVLGRPRLLAGISAGALDSMVAHYTAFRKKRGQDAYTPGGRAGARPNRATIVYANLARWAFPGLPLVLGGIEASLRRISHYDFWTDKLRRSILLDAKADFLAYGMAEKTLTALAKGLDQGLTPNDPAWLNLPGVVVKTGPEPPETTWPMEELPSLEEIEADPFQLMTATLALEDQVLNRDRLLLQTSGGQRLALTPPPEPLSTEELDHLYALPFARRAHPSYQEPIPALTMVQTSLTSHRGCGGGCTFCSLALHQGRRLRSRSAQSLLDEAARLTKHPDWRGSISDLGGPSANMWAGQCLLPAEKRCRRSSCLHPRPCRYFQVDQRAGLDLLRRIKALEGVKHVRVASGLRHDLALADQKALKELVAEFVGGQLKIAPEHLSGPVLELMRKPGREVFEEFLACFDRETDRAGKEQYVIPYLMSAFPGCTDEDMRTLAAWLKARGWRPRQVQCFIPTPGTVATAMFFAAQDSRGKPIPVAKSDAERLRQHHILIPATKGKEAKGKGARPPKGRTPQRKRRSRD